MPATLGKAGKAVKPVLIIRTLVNQDLTQNFIPEHEYQRS